MSALEGEISRCTSDQLLGLKENINTLFAKCVQMLAHEHNIRVVNALLVGAAAREPGFTSHNGHIDCLCFDILMQLLLVIRR